MIDKAIYITSGYTGYMAPLTMSGPIITPINVSLTVCRQMVVLGIPVNEYDMYNKEITPLTLASIDGRLNPVVEAPKKTTPIPEVKKEVFEEKAIQIPKTVILDKVEEDTSVKEPVEEVKKVETSEETIDTNPVVEEDTSVKELVVEEVKKEKIEPKKSNKGKKH